MSPVRPRRVLLIGANAALSAATADAFVADGGRVAGVGLDTTRREHYSSFTVADVTDSEVAWSVVRWAAAELGGIDTLVLAAAKTAVSSAESTSDETWRSTLSSILDTAFFVTRAALPLLEPGSAIVAVSSVNGRVSAPGLAAYSAAKAGLEGLVRQLAFEYGVRGIRVNAVVPGSIRPADDRLLEGQPLDGGYPLGRIGTPEEVAAAIRFLATEESSFITGASLPVDGGLTISSPAAWLRPDLRAQWLPSDRR